MKKPQISQIKKLLKNDASIEAAYLFGSQAAGRANKYSDVDIGVLFDDRLPPSRYADRQLAIIDSVSRVSGREVDAVILNRASSFLKFQVLKQGIRIYEKPGRIGRSFEARAIMEYYDYLPIKTLIENAMIKRIKKVH